MEQIFHGQFSLHDAAIFGCKYTKNTTFILEKEREYQEKDFCKQALPPTPYLSGRMDASLIFA